MEKLRAVITNNSLFRISYIVCLFFCNVSFIQVPAYVSLVFLFLWGVFLLFYNERKRRVFTKTRFGLWLLAFVFFSTITAVIHIADNFLYNMVIQFHVCICFFIFYGLHTEKHLNFRRELYSVCRFMVYTTTIVGVMGLACMMAGISFEVMSIKFIIYENRFTGIYSNPNTLGFVSVVALFCVHMLTKTNFIEISGQERVSRIWLLSAVAINGMSLFLCDSNGAIVLIVFYVITFVLYKMFGSEREFSKKQIVVKLVALMIAGVFVTSSVFFVRFFTQAGFTEILEKAEAGLQIEKTEGMEEDMFYATERITFGHLNKNLDSGRFRLWRQAASLFSDFPLFGIGKGNVYDYGETKFDNGIAFSDIYGEALSKFATDFHNGYATILVCSGIVGFVLFSLFGLRFAKHISIHVFKAKNLKESILPCMYSFLCAYLVYAFFEKALLYDVSFTVLFFWLIMGYVSCFLCAYEPDYQEGIYLFKRKLRKTML
ncbi:MAG: O-antigen ligase family protein [Ruminococcus sp.]|nr:O-antigen ligase family protein [Ruminococcus sp.]